MKKKIAYLTIDDAPSNNFDLILKYLSENKIPAIFFCEERKILKRPEEVIKAIKTGISSKLILLLA
ncbi:MAG: polysaccharide deacetylase family protein [Candidatus Stygibacter australis]|nr:polysaccharide deacetylase family protein [Candidatus Stygibacter australis]